VRPLRYEEMVTPQGGSGQDRWPEGAGAPEEPEADPLRELGRRTYQMVEHLVSSFTLLPAATGGGEPGAAVRVVEALGSIQERLDRVESQLNSMHERLRRLDRWLLDGARQPGQGGAADQGRRSWGPRLAKEETRARALEAAWRLRQRGAPVTLRSVAREAGLRYSQVVYAFQRREELLRQVGARPAAEGQVEGSLTA